MLGKVEGKRPRTPSRWRDQVTMITGLPIATPLRTAENRVKWRKLVHETMGNFQEHDL